MENLLKGKEFINKDITTALKLLLKNIRYARVLTIDLIMLSVYILFNCE